MPEKWIAGLGLGLMLFAVRGAAAAIPAGAGCAPSAAAAVERMLGRVQGDGGVEGFRVVSVRNDALRKRAWAMVVSCSDAARPVVAIELAEGVGVSGLGLPAERRVRIGDRVAVMQEGADSRMDLAGWAEDSGEAHDLIRVRLPSFSLEDGAPPVIRCRVVGMDVVEVVR